MKKFITTTYTVKSNRLKRNPLVFLMISDLHNVVFGKDNQVLFDAMRAEHPDLILIAGDLVLGKKGAPLKPALDFLKEAIKIAPICYEPGNHEQRMEDDTEKYGTVFEKYRKEIESRGIVYLSNQRVQVRVKGEKLGITGLALPYSYYKKGKVQPPELQELEEKIGKPSEDAFEILLAHTPRFGNTYFEWGADLILSGHYHGGMMRLPKFGSVISPDFRLFPSYGCGLYEKDSKGRKNVADTVENPVSTPVMITGAGLGEHTLPIRIHNPEN